MPILLHLTAVYSNAVLVAILPQVSQTAEKLHLPIRQPVSLDQVSHFNVSPYKDFIGGGLWLTNGYWFTYSFGCVNGFHSPDNVFTIQNFDRIERFVGKENITTNDAILLARSAFTNLGYSLATYRLDNPPTEFQVPADLKGAGHIPFCNMTWKSPDSILREASYSASFSVDMQKNQIVGMALSGTNFWRVDPVIGVAPEAEADYQKRIHPKMFINTNAPKFLGEKRN